MHFEVEAFDTWRAVFVDPTLYIILNTNKIKEKSAPKSYIFEIVVLIFSIVLLVFIISARFSA